MEIFSIDHHSHLPLHIQVEQLLRGLISDPEYQNGKLFPNEVDIAKRMGISRNTVRQALNKLVQEGLLTRKKGVGTKVSKNNITTKLNKWSSFTLEMHEKGVAFKTYDLKVDWVEADQATATLFGIVQKSKVLKLERLRGLDNGPIVHFISYFHPRVGLTPDEDFSRPLYEMLEKDHHTVVSVSKEEISATLADDHLAHILQVNTGDPILLRKRVVCDPGDRPIEYNLGYYRADRFTYAIDIAR
ncbi:GntR family transcriptional regulator [Dyadobacter jejuensis]|uniref:GntR family transcriptional regulator n=1 Tax=Dyadobacter jejuensis TaxID=1082580 RepID=A0A316A9Z2_9BACT|nr:GntR family transcriptional regulator [Dyadobacter jejuensis]PWJ54473.1 GntR family transcriptional regulator [Dyadobacter jejuensis]